MISKLFWVSLVRGEIFAPLRMKTFRLMHTKLGTKQHSSHWKALFDAVSRGKSLLCSAEAWKMCDVSKCGEIRGLQIVLLLFHLLDGRTNFRCRDSWLDRDSTRNYCISSNLHSTWLRQTPLSFTFNHFAANLRNLDRRETTQNLLAFRQKVFSNCFALNSFGFCCFQLFSSPCLQLRCLANVLETLAFQWSLRAVATSSLAVVCWWKHGEILSACVWGKTRCCCANLSQTFA